jgi:hypothetical protein
VARVGDGASALRASTTGAMQSGRSRGRRSATGAAHSDEAPAGPSSTRAPSGCSLTCSTNARCLRRGFRTPRLPSCRWARRPRCARLARTGRPSDLPWERGDRIVSRQQHEAFRLRVSRPRASDTRRIGR